tara:strand:- start:1681 stop:1971 length:291 start_codon:yes stop_codon:yes gene_type:complete
VKVTDDIVQHIAHLARLDFEGKDLDSIKDDMQKIIAFVDKLSEIDTENVEPLIFMNKKVNVLREDISNQTLTKENALANAPKSDSDYFRIPKVLDK